MGETVDPAKLFRELMAKINAHMAKKSWKLARRDADIASTYARDKSQRNQLRQVYNRLDAEGQKLLKKYREAFEKKLYLEAIDGYEDICSTFGRLPCAVAAGKTLKQAKSIPEVKGLLQERKARRWADLIESAIWANRQARDKAGSPPAKTTGKFVSQEKRLASNAGKSGLPAGTKAQISRVEQIKSLDLDKQAKVVELMEKVAKLYPLSQTGKRAAGDIKVLRKDKAFQTRLKEYRQTKNAERLYELGEAYRKANLHPKALKYYRQVIQEFPGTEVAAKAKAMAHSLEKRATN